MSEKRLTDKQQLFVKEYAVCLNATEAARRAGYKTNNGNTLGVIGAENLRKPKIRAEIDRLLVERTMKADEVLARLADHAEGSIEDFISVNELTGWPTFDFNKAKELGKLHLIKKIKYNRNGLLESVELHDPQAALKHLGKAYALFTNKIETVNWRTRAIEDIKANKIAFGDLAETFDVDLATELFMQAGVPVDNVTA